MATANRPSLGAGGRRKDLYLLSTDDNLLLELGPLVGEAFRTRPIETAEQLNDAGSVPWLVFIDARVLADAQAQVALIEQKFRLAPQVVVCPDGRAGEWTHPLARGSVCAVIERGALKSAALGSALSAAELRLNSVAPMSPSTHQERAPGAPKSATRAVPWLLLGPTVLLAGAGAWYLLSTKHSASTPPSVPVPPGEVTVGTEVPATLPSRATTTPLRTVLELLSSARIAFRDEKNLLPRNEGGVRNESARGDSALELYTGVLAQEPENEEARDGMRRLFSVARVRIQADLAAGKLDDASRLLAAFRNVGLANDATAKLDADVAAVRPRWLTTQARAALANGDTVTASQLMAQIAAGGGDRAVLTELRHGLDQRKTDTQETDLAGRVRAAIGSGALLEPAGDNARTRLQAMLQLNRNHPLTLTVQHELQLALLAHAQSAAHTGQFEVAQRQLNSAAELGNNAELANARKQVQSDVDAARERTTAPKDLAAVPVATAGDAGSSAAGNNASAGTAEPGFIAAKPATPLQATYPEQAALAHQQGYAIVEFTLDVKGHASDPKVVQSNPSSVFDSAAIQAVRRGRYDTTALGESGKSRRARIKISFKP